MNGEVDISLEEIAGMDKQNLRISLFRALHFVAEAVSFFCLLFILRVLSSCVCVLTFAVLGVSSTEKAAGCHGRKIQKGEIA